jgi:hypothetical protein
VVSHGWEQSAPTHKLALKASVLWRDRETGADMVWACWSVLEAERDAIMLRADGHENVRVESRR